MSQVLGEMNALRTADGAAASRYYVGFVPKSSHGTVGLGYVPGKSSVVAASTPNQSVVLETVVHEVGHNFSLKHAPCGNPANPDANYPYANGTLGAAGRYIWGYRIDQGTFVDPGDTSLHDLMSYCTGDTYSDYNYRRAQTYLTPADAYQVGPSVAQARVPAQELLLVAGTLTHDRLQLQPLKRLSGVPVGAGSGIYTARFTTAKGVSEVAFDVEAVDHDPGSAGFAFTVPDPGALTRIEIFRSGKLLLDQRAAAGSAAPTLSKSTDSPLVNATESGGSLVLRWNAATSPFLSVAHIGNGRTTLAFDLKGGAARLPLQGVPAGGSFEFTLSDGMNSTRMLQVR